MVLVMIGAVVVPVLFIEVVWTAYCQTSLLEAYIEAMGNDNP